MKNIFIFYVVTQLVTTAYGIAVIESVKPFVEKSLTEQGYHKNKNSLYRFNYTLSNILKGFIPFYYLFKALNIVVSKGDISREVDNEIKTKNYITDEDEIEEVKPVEVKEEVVEPDINFVFDRPEKYTARKNDFKLFETYEEPIEYDTREAKNDDELELSPFINNNEVNVIKEEKDTEKEEPKQEVVKEKIIIKEEASMKDVAKAICDLDLEDLLALKGSINSLIDLKVKE